MEKKLVVIDQFGLFSKVGHSPLLCLSQNILGGLFCAPSPTWGSAPLCFPLVTPLDWSDIVIIIKDIFIVQVHKNLKCAMSAEMAV